MKIQFFKLTLTFNFFGKSNLNSIYFKWSVINIPNFNSYTLYVDGQNSSLSEVILPCNMFLEKAILDADPSVVLVFPIKVFVSGSF